MRMVSFIQKNFPKKFSLAYRLGPQIYKKDNTAGVSLLTMHGATNEDVGIAIDVGTLQCNLDGVGVNYKACGIATSMAIGCVDVSLAQI